MTTSSGSTLAPSNHHPDDPYLSLPFMISEKGGSDENEYLAVLAAAAASPLPTTHTLTTHVNQLEGSNNHEEQHIRIVCVIAVQAVVIIRRIIVIVQI